jgi:hypothetical protein
MTLALFSCHSPKKIFNAEVETFKSGVNQSVETILVQDIAHLPAPVVRYFKKCGYVGAVKPAYALQDYIIWEPVDERTANARFVHKGVDVGGTFHFNERGEYIRFTSNDRPFLNPDGTYTKQPYTIEIRSYQQQGEQLIAKDVAAIWNLPQGDYEYWTGSISKIR